MYKRQAEEEADEVIENVDESKLNQHKKSIFSFLPSSDPYHLLGLGEVRWRASEQELKNAYHTAALQAHPDKNGGDDSRFKALNEAWDLLNTEQKRRAFDSTDSHFDDSIPAPTGELSPAEFFATYGPVFERNEHWCDSAVSYKLGDMSTPYNTVERFYSFWRIKFRSWRDFSSFGEYDVKEAGSREEKRWMENKNKKVENVKRRAEMNRISRLVENAFRADPRVAENMRLVKIQRAEARQAQKESVKARRQEQRRVRAAQAAVEREAEAAQAAERMAQAAQLRQQRMALEEKRQEVRRVVSKYPHDAQALEAVCLRLGAAELQQLLGKLEHAGDKCAAVLVETYRESEKSEKSRLEVKQQQEAVEKARDHDAWTADELAQLALLLKKYPGGYPNRWDKVAELLATKTKRQIISKTKQLQDDRPDEVVKSNADDANKAAWERFQATKKTAKREITAGVSYSKEAYDIMLQQEATSRKGPWTYQEQEQFEAGIREVPSDSPDRWDLIAKFVPTRSVPQIQQRYRFCWLLVNKPQQGQALLAKRKAQWQSDTAGSSS